jgi:hypothetical protein
MDLAEIDSMPDLMLTQGGPGDALLHHLRLAQPQSHTGSRREALMLAAITWVPLCLFAMLEGLAFRRVTIPFFDDIATHVRFLVAVPILILADVPIGARLRQVARQFLTAGIVRDKDAYRYGEIVTSALKLRDSRVAELVLLGLAYLATYQSMKGVVHSGSTWFRPVADLTPVGYWYAFVSLPIWMFLIWRWIFREVVWSRFLWQVSKIDLFLTPAHPDSAGGLGFLGKGLIPFGIVAFAISSVTCGSAASRIIFSGARLEDFQSAFIVLAILMLVVFVGPLMVFAPTLINLRQTGLLRYGILASRYTELFDTKWVESAQATDDRILGTEDIQSLGSLGDSYDMIRRMRVVPLEISDFIALVLPTVIPALPLLLTVVPMKVILSQLFRLIA